MVEDDLTVEEMRKPPANRRVKRSFMSPRDMVRLRTEIMRVTKKQLAEQLLNPSTGHPINRSSLTFWETGRRPVPLWVARRIKDLAEAAKAYDAKRQL